MKLDTFVSNNKIKNIDFIKVDIECHEPEFIKGGIMSIEKFKPIIIIENLYNKIGRLVQSQMSHDWEYYHLSTAKKLVKCENLRRVDGEWNYLLYTKQKNQFYMIKSNLKFSLILPTFNRSKTIDKTIESVINQTYKHWELII